MKTVMFKQLALHMRFTVGSITYEKISGAVARIVSIDRLPINVSHSSIIGQDDLVHISNDDEPKLRFRFAESTKQSLTSNVQIHLAMSLNGQTDVGMPRHSTEHISKSLKTVMRQHEKGFSVTHYNKFFTKLNGVEVPNSEEWIPARHQEWLSQRITDVVIDRYREREDGAIDSEDKP